MSEFHRENVLDRQASLHADMAWIPGEGAA
jgi:hypothetical protein